MPLGIVNSGSTYNLTNGTRNLETYVDDRPYKEFFRAYDNFT